MHSDLMIRKPAAALLTISLCVGMVVSLSVMETWPFESVCCMVLC
ncbi:Uncharacterised protein [Serratia marcescens]|nr:Uncharacterised protein [Serratia marcescens]CUY14194.1 Uncharacterised protein [Serratia marcescens]CUY65789.1 Uncharacterised protein [Serratia marcescens]CUZ00198.1 Uncharacterised protein [Serratia marcescens]CUZ28679.1 Uncharacterised protein [Serratia marcescens]